MCWGLSCTNTALSPYKSTCDLMSLSTKSLLQCNSAPSECNNLEAINCVNKCIMYNLITMALGVHPPLFEFSNDSNNHRDHGTGKKRSVHGIFVFGRKVQQREHTRVEKGARGKCERLGRVPQSVLQRNI
jgi:hypothetical protein